MLRNGHVQTILGALIGQKSGSVLCSIRKVMLPDGDTLVVHEDNPRLKPEKIALMIHGVATDADCSQMKSLSKAFTDSGWVVWRMNQRNCGAGFGYARNIYHAGRSDDLQAVVSFITSKYPDVPIVLVGMSLGGNVLLKLLAESRNLGSVIYSIALNPSIDLEKCVIALEKPANFLYQFVFVERLKAQVKKLTNEIMGFPQLALGNISSLRSFDDQVTAVLGGFTSGRSYYAKSSASPLWSDIKNSVLVLSAADDPFVPARIFKDLPFNPYVRIEVVEFGGHLGYLHSEEGKIKTWLPEYCVYVAEEQFQRKRQSKSDNEHSLLSGFDHSIRVKSPLIALKD